MQPLAIAIDLGGTQLRAALVNQAGTILERQAVLTNASGGPDAVLTQIQTIAEDITRNVGMGRIIGIGVSSPGPLDTTEGLALSLPTLPGFDNYPLREALRHRLGRPVSLENDGIVGALGEWTFGAGRGYGNVVYVTVSTGIGGGVIADGKVLRGRRGMAGHVGHMILVPDGALCNCGNRGCFEAYGSGPAFAARARQRVHKHGNTSLSAHGAEIDSPAVFAAAKAGDRLASELVQEEAAILGTGLTSLAHLFSPDVIVMGGGLSNAFDALIPGIRARIAECAMPAFRDVRVVCAELGGNSGLMGAASLVFTKMDEPTVA